MKKINGGTIIIVNYYSISNQTNLYYEKKSFSFKNYFGNKSNID